MFKATNEHLKTMTERREVKKKKRESETSYTKRIKKKWIQRGRSKQRYRGAKEEWTGKEITKERKKKLRVRVKEKNKKKKS